MMLPVQAKPNQAPRCRPAGGGSGVAASPAPAPH